MTCHLTNAFNSASTPENKKQKGRKAPLIDYPQGTPSERSSPSKPHPPTRETNSNSTRSDSERSGFPSESGYAGPEGCKEQSTRAHHLSLGQAEASDFLPEGKWYKEWLAENRFNPRRHRPMSQWLSDWEKDFKSLG